MQHSVIEHDGSHAGIKLPRELVRNLTVGKLSPSFSHTQLTDGMQLHLFCTSDSGTITDAVHGRIKQVSRKGARKWAFLPDLVENLKVFDVGKLVRL